MATIGEAVAPGAPYAGGTEELEQRTMRKVTRRIVPFIILLYFIAFLDRVNVGFAAITMNDDIGLTPAMFGLGAGVFFIGYFAFEVPSNIILHKVGARFWIARVMVTWGLVSGGMAFVQGPASFYTLRFLLGLAEAGFFPGIILYLSYWFPAKRRAAVTALFMAAAPIAGFFGGPISGAIMGLHGVLGLKGWQWLFVLEAIPAVILGFVVFRYLTDKPHQATWLEADERDWLVAAMNHEHDEKGPASKSHSPWQALRDRRVLALALAYFGTSAGLYTVGIWAPLIIKEFNYTPFQVGLLTAIPNFAAVIGMVLWSRSSDRRKERFWHSAGGCLVGAVGMALAANATGSVILALLGLSLTAIGVNAAKPTMWTIPTSFLSGSAAAAGIGLINSLGTLGGAVGPYMIGSAKGSSGSFAQGLYFVGGALVLSAVVILLLRRSVPQGNAVGSLSR